MSNIHFSVLDDVKMTCITQVSFKLLLGKGHVYIDILDLENETSISIWEFEMMNVLKNIFAFIIASYTIKFTEQK